ncbi:uncharacterized protein LACBIDRAFT_310538 [Laccaria bicolor S238N-H82]|uniref:Predicted protein n=1 Tax=Laccaria bicolor (strain S238N-H82 / ATCC MYA-4686) TaxID=486041 RepID=B0DUJ8_LACBS|nr:uncharacterized protein LACBIDRAFT_310538 [Laccaria bicolor S238N-H82]EDR01754.1 predicted protein [Laccaria bicolor S238N-H82]|eukprot:XP_001887567.1 predicted protein [Laccaria bicolor S238N-H82]
MHSAQFALTNLTTWQVGGIEEPIHGQANLSWANVAMAMTFIVFNVGVSTVCHLGVGVSLMVAALRCVGQLAVVATLLQKVFETHNPWLVALISFILNFLGTFETVVNKSKRRFKHMFPAVLFAMLGSTIPISILGTKFAMSVDPFWTPIQYIPIVGMLCGATISGVVVSVSYLLKELRENRDKVEIFLAFGATRMEACRPIIIEALRLALTPSINSMSVLGIIAIPGMMTGAILGGSSVQQAAKLQMIIMFMITASTTLASFFVTFAVIFVVVDAEHRIRSDRIYDGKHGLWALNGWSLKKFWERLRCTFQRRKNEATRELEQSSLLG